VTWGGQPERKEAKSVGGRNEGWLLDMGIMKKGTFLRIPTYYLGCVERGAGARYLRSQKSKETTKDEDKPELVVK